MGDIQVVIADSQPLTLSGLRSAVADHADIRVLAECKNPERLSDTVRNHSPDVLLESAEFLDDGLDGVEDLISEMQDTRVILLTSRKDHGFLEGALRCGAKGVFQREKPVHQIPQAIRKVTNGGIWLEPEAAERMLEEVLSNRRTPDPEERKIAQLTPREREMIELICEGLKNKEVSSRLHISEATVAHHLSSIYRKLEVEDRTSLVIYAVKQHLVNLWPQ